MADSSINRIRQLPQALVAHFIQTYLTDASAFALIATEKETFHRYRHWYIMKSERSWLCLQHRWGSEREWIFIHLREPRADAQLLTDSMKMAPAGADDAMMEPVDESDRPIAFTHASHLSSTSFIHPLSIGLMKPSRIKLYESYKALCEDSLDTRVDLTALPLPTNLKCFPSPLPNTVKHLSITPSFDCWMSRYGRSRWSAIVYSSRLEVIEFERAYPRYFTKDMKWPRTLHTMIINCVCPQDFVTYHGTSSDFTTRMYLPTTLTELTILFESDPWFRDNWNNLKLVELPSDLKRLNYLSARFSPMNCKLPSSLLELVLGDSFNHPITDWILPPNLTRLQFGNKFNQSLNGVNWPKSLTEITITGTYACGLVDQFPSSVKLSIMGHPVVMVDDDYKSKVLDVIAHGHASETEYGPSIAVVCSQLEPHLTLAQIEAAIEELYNEGHIYATIDDEHFKSTM